MDALAELMPAVLCRHCRAAVPLVLFVMSGAPRDRASCPGCGELVVLPTQPLPAA